MWAVKNSQNRRSARSGGEKSAGVVVRGAAGRRGEHGGGGTFSREQVGEHGGGVYADCDGA